MLDAEKISASEESSHLRILDRAVWGWVDHERKEQCKDRWLFVIRLDPDTR